MNQANRLTRASAAILAAIAIAAAISYLGPSFGQAGSLMREDGQKPRITGLIQPGLGLAELPVGTRIEKVKSILGEPDPHIPLGNGEFRLKTPREVDPSERLVYKSLGLAFDHREGRVSEIFFRFRDRTYVSFEGETDKRIGMLSTVGQVIRAYGTPDKTEDHHAHSAAAQPANLFYRWLIYEKLNIAFLFGNGELLQISVGGNPR